MSSRNWIKIYCANWLQSEDLRSSPSDVRAVWIDLLCLAGVGAYGDVGVIKITPTVGIPDETLASILGIQVERWKEIKDFFSEKKMIKVHENNIIEILNWKTYQSEYHRQKPYREKKKEKLSLQEAKELGLISTIGGEKND